MSVYELRASMATNMIQSTVRETRQPGERTQKRIEFAIRFVLLAVPGLLLFLFCCLALIAELSYSEIHVMHPLLAVFLAFAGALMILAGPGQRGHWAYLWVFLSLPIAASIWVLLSPFLPDGPPGQHGIDARLLGLLVFALPMIVSYAVVRQHYRHKAHRRSELLPSAETSQGRRPKN
jgi:hypothetical protein